MLLPVVCVCVCMCACGSFLGPGYLPHMYALITTLLTVQRNPLHTSEKGQTVKTLGVVGHKVSITATQLCRCSAKAAVDNA